MFSELLFSINIYCIQLIITCNQYQSQQVSDCSITCTSMYRRDRLLLSIVHFCMVVNKTRVLGITTQRYITFLASHASLCSLKRIVFVRAARMAGQVVPVLFVAHNTHMIISTCSFRPMFFAIKSDFIVVSSWPFEGLSTRKVTNKAMCQL